MVTHEYSAYGAAYTPTDVATEARPVASASISAGHEASETPQVLGSFLLAAKVATYWAFGAMIVSLPFANYMEFDSTQSPPAWAAASYFIGLSASVVLLSLIPARVLARAILFLLGDGTSRTGARLRLGSVALVLAMTAVGVTASLM